MFQLPKRSQELLGVTETSFDTSEAPNDSTVQQSKTQYQDSPRTGIEVHLPVEEDTNNNGPQHPCHHDIELSDCIQPLSPIFLTGTSKDGKLLNSMRKQSITTPPSSPSHSTVIQGAKSTFSKIFRVFQPSVSSEPRCKSSPRMALCGFNTHPRKRDRSFSLDNADGSHRYLRPQNFERHSWYGGGKHSLKRNRDIVSYGLLRLPINGNEPLHSLARPMGNRRKSSGCFDETACFEGREMVVKVDVHRSASGETAGISKDRGFKPIVQTKKLHEYKPDEIVIRVDSGRIPSRRQRRPLVMPRRVPVPPDMNSSGRLLTDLNGGGGLCREWLRAVDNTAQMCPGTEYVGPFLIATSMCIFSAAIITVVVVFTWVMGNLLLGLRA